MNAFEIPNKVAFISQADFDGDLLYAHECSFQQSPCPLHSQMPEVLQRSSARFGFEDVA